MLSQFVAYLLLSAECLMRHSFYLLYHLYTNHPQEITPKFSNMKLQSVVFFFFEFYGLAIGQGSSLLSVILAGLSHVVVAIWQVCWGLDGRKWPHS